MKRNDRESTPGLQERDRFRQDLFQRPKLVVDSEAESLEDARRGVNGASSASFSSSSSSSSSSSGWGPEPADGEGELPRGLDPACFFFLLIDFDFLC